MTLFWSTFFHCNADEEKKKEIPGWGHCLCGIRMFPLPPHHVSVMQLDELVSLQCECGCECALQWNGVLSRMSPLLQPELSGCALANHHPILE